MDDTYLLALCTCPDEDVAERIASDLVTEGHAACANIIPGLTSVFFWEDKAEKDPEVLLLIKTTGRAYPAMEERIQEMHPYELPEIIAVRIDRGLGEYLNWISTETE